MRGVYTVAAEITALATAKTLLLGQCPSTMMLEILSAKLTDANQSTVEQWEVGLYNVSTVGSPAGSSISSVNIQATEPAGAATSITWLYNLTTEPSAYASLPIDDDGVTNIAGYRYNPMPEERRIIAPSAYFGLRLISTPTNSFKAKAQITYREIG